MAVGGNGQQCCQNGGCQLIFLFSVSVHIKGPLKINCNDLQLFIITYNYLQLFAFFYFIR
jgi:hypothetical protein